RPPERPRPAASWPRRLRVPRAGPGPGQDDVACTLLTLGWSLDTQRDPRRPPPHPRARTTRARRPSGARDGAGRGGAAARSPPNTGRQCSRPSQPRTDARLSGARTAQRGPGQRGTGAARRWVDDERLAIPCPVPGYDRHFALGERFGMELISVAMTDEGPDMDVVKRLVATDRRSRGSGATASTATRPVSATAMWSWSGWPPCRPQHQTSGPSGSSGTTRTRSTTSRTRRWIRDVPTASEA